MDNLAEIIARIKADAAKTAPTTLGVLDCRHCGQTAHWCDCATRCPWNI